MDTLGVCGEPSIAANNGVVMVKDPESKRGEPENLYSHLSDGSEHLDGWTDRKGGKRRLTLSPCIEGKDRKCDGVGGWRGSPP